MTNEFPYFSLNEHKIKFRPHSDQRHRIHAVREEMRIRASLHGSEIDAYIITSYDDHLNEDVADHDKRRQYISGFTGPSAVVAVGFITIALHAVSHETVSHFHDVRVVFRGFQFQIRLHCMPLRFGRTTNFCHKPIPS